MRFIKTKPLMTLIDLFTKLIRTFLSISFHLNTIELNCSELRLILLPVRKYLKTEKSI